MNIKSTKIILLILVLATLFPLDGAQKEPDIDIPLRFAQPGNFIPGLKAEDIQLVINGETRQISNLKYIERSVGSKAGLGRNFILSFHMTEYGTLMEKGLAYFISDILDPADALLLVSPIKIYQINVTVNKEKIIEEIGTILKKDCLDYKKKRSLAEKGLRSKIISVKKALNDNTKNGQYGVHQFLNAKKFIDTFPQEFLKFINLSLIMNTEKYDRIIELLGLREGERYWIHFHQDELAGLLSFIQGFLKDFSQYIASREARETRRLLDLEKSLAVVSSFPVKPLTQTLVGHGISYNLLVFRGSAGSEGSNPHSPDISRRLGELAQNTGGTFIKTTEPGRAIEQLRNHRDRCYEISFPFNGKIQSKKITLNLSSQKMKLLYKKEFSQEELTALIHYLNSEKVEITDLKNRKGKAAFTIESFKHHKEGKYGILKVSLQILDQNSAPLYRTENTLRSSQEKIALAIPIPKRIKGKSRVRITVLDLLANREITREKELVFN